jgi:N-acetylglutamate synthase-like GNAT family acetyltransferase
MPIGPIVRLRPAHLNQLEALLASNGLPAEDCAEQGDIFCGIFDRDELLAAGGLEAAADYCLLRSIVVKPHYHGRGLGRAIAEFLLEQARAQGKVAVYLLTETAAEYFEKLGFSQVERAHVPAAIASTRQFSSLCPDSARCLMTDLSRDWPRLTEPR